MREADVDVFWDERQVETPLTLTRTIKDPIHDFIAFSAYIWSFIDTRQFQRLRAIKQLGVSYYVWGGASHNRFEHCIGVAHLAAMLVEKLRREQPELGITDRDVRCVQLAGLCHDLGHGPWSHVWDGHFIPVVLPDQAWTHEDASEMMFDDLVKRNNISIDQDDVNFIKDLIKGTVRHSARKEPPEKKFLFDIVANKRNGIDVDKFDYIARDVRAIGDHNNFSAGRLIDSARVINDEICFHIKDANSVYELCTLRFSNHKRIYSHKTARAIEYMIVDALKAAEPAMNIARLILDPAKYVYLTDNIMERIEMSEDPALAESQRIFDRVRKRDLYRCVDWGTFGYDMLSSLREAITPEAIVRTAKALFRSGGSKRTGPSKEVVDSLSPEHVIADLGTIHFGMKEKNPIEFVRFYGKHNIRESFKAEPGELSTLMPASFAEVQLRIYTKESIYYGLVQAGYRELLVTLSDEPTPPYLNLAGSPSPPTTDAPSTPRVGAAAASPPPNSQNAALPNMCLPKSKTPSLNKFTRVDPSFAPTSPSLSAKRRAPSVPPTSLSVSEVKRTHRASASVDSPGRALVVQDSLKSIGSEATEVGSSQPGTSRSARTLVDGPYRALMSKEPVNATEERPEVKPRTPTKSKLKAPWANGNGVVRPLDKPKLPEDESELVPTDTDTDEAANGVSRTPTPAVRSSSNGKSKSLVPSPAVAARSVAGSVRGARRRRTDAGDSPASTGAGRARAKRAKS